MTDTIEHMLRRTDTDIQGDRLRITDTMGHRYNGSHV